MINEDIDSIANEIRGLLEKLQEAIKEGEMLEEKHQRGEKVPWTDYLTEIIELNLRLSQATAKLALVLNEKLDKIKK